MAAKHSLATALRTVRRARGLSQEAFSDVSSRTYLSVLERDLKSPTLSKLSDICDVLNVHPVTLLVLAYSGGTPEGVRSVLDQVREELRELRESPIA
ncbi:MULTISPECIES: helix-turn-helix domain-containing protein [Achromobacter]|uniref:helix-turn-helix domain-containing protein n=1 Tax=Achromobacter TaxID=222 RepID=UPI000CEB5F77|nr:MULTISPECIES: helix-turn-helix transcriptional regulator [Achromobacter]AVG44134.1 XRE family transcriptional regulator [Achromobacter insolitus]